MNVSRMITILTAFAISAVGAAAELALAPGQFEARYQAKIEVQGDSVKLVSDTPEWDAGLRINPPKGEKFDFTSGKFLAVDVENLSPDRQLRLTMHISSGNRDNKSNSHVELPHREVNTGIGLNPGEKRTMRIYLPHASLFTAPEGGKNIRSVLDTAKINSIEFKMQWPFEAGRKGLINCRISNVRLEGEPDLARRVKADYFPFIDTYGQFRHTEWPEKIHSDQDLREAHATELAQLAETPAPAEWNEFGGWANGPQLKATGNFRVEKYQDKWFFVDPAGRLFWSLGIDVIQPSTDAVNGRKHPNWFEGAMPADGIYDFNRMNLRKKYGKEDFQADFYEVLNQRLKAWGINTIGNWSAFSFIETGKMPYVMSLGEIRDFERLGMPVMKDARFYDVYDPRFEEKMGQILKLRAAADPVIAKSLTDPMCIGYFIDNEIRYENLARKVMATPATQPAKQELVRQLKATYGTIGKLNQSWKSSFADWDALAAATEAPKSDGFGKDARAFEEKFVTRYFETCRKGIKGTAPQRLYLGSRFIGFRQPGYVWAAATKNCDVVTVNTYSNSVNNTNRGDFRDRPIMVGEFHFGTYDRGMFSSSLAPVGDQQERATALTRFVQGALVHPNFVGAHWFQFRDQPLTGRYDGEGYQIGFVDVADTPYPAMTQAAREIGENMYRYRSAGKLNDSMVTENDNQ